jgi:hypothetical protein
MGLCAIVALAPACGGDGAVDNGAFPVLARGTVSGEVTGAGGVPLDSVVIVFTAPPELAMYEFQSARALSDVQGQFSLPIDLVSAPDPNAPPDTLALYITARAGPPRYTPPPGEDLVSDSLLVPVALAETGVPPVSEVHLSLPVAPAAGVERRGP